VVCRDQRPGRAVGAPLAQEAGVGAGLGQEGAKAGTDACRRVPRLRRTSSGNTGGECSQVLLLACQLSD